MPATTRSIAASKCFRTMDSERSLAAMRAASLHTFATSAPVKPGVRAAIFFESSPLSSSVFSSPRWTLVINCLMHNRRIL